MAPLKFEDQMKEKLEQRTLSPSKDSWKKLEQLLDSNEKEHKNSSYRWIGIAAGFTGMLFVLAYLLGSPGEEIDPNNNYVDTTEDVKNIKKEGSIPIANERKNSYVNTDSTAILVNSHNSKIKDVASPYDKDSSREKDAETDMINRTSLSDISAEKKGITSPKSATMVSNKDKVVKDALLLDSIDIKEKVHSILAEVQAMEDQNQEVTEREIDLLLQKAQRELAAESIQQSNRINASTLLSEVESDLEETFKEKVYEALKIGFNKLKTSVVERNN